MEILYFILGGVVFLILFSVVTYNGLVSKRNMVRNTFSSIDVNLKKRADLIPSLVETVKSYAAHEKEVFTRAMELRKRLNTEGDTQERLQMEGSVPDAFARLFALAEAYPEIKSDRQFLNLQRNLTEVEEQLSAARRAYNAAVMAQNTAVESFPSNVVARGFSFQPHEYYEMSAIERESPTVLFHG